MTQPGCEPSFWHIRPIWHLKYEKVSSSKPQQPLCDIKAPAAVNKRPAAWAHWPSWTSHCPPSCFKYAPGVLPRLAYDPWPETSSIPGIDFMIYSTLPKTQTVSLTVFPLQSNSVGAQVSICIGVCECLPQLLLPAALSTDLQQRWWGRPHAFLIISCILSPLK